MIGDHECALRDVAACWLTLLSQRMEYPSQSNSRTVRPCGPASRTEDHDGSQSTDQTASIALVQVSRSLSVTMHVAHYLIALPGQQRVYPPPSATALPARGLGLTPLIMQIPRCLDGLRSPGLCPIDS